MTMPERDTLLRILSHTSPDLARFISSRCNYLSSTTYELYRAGSKLQDGTICA